MSALLPVYERDLVIVSGKGSKVTDSEGHTYLDFAAGIGVNGLGYGDRRVTAAIRKQAGRVVHSSNLYFSQPVIDLAERLAELAFPSRVFFTNSGTEAIEAAIKFARRIGHAQGRTELVAFEKGFHGRTMGALSLTWNERYRKPFEPLVPDVVFRPWDDLTAARAAIGGRTAAVFLEPVQGEGGVRPAPLDFVRGLADLCRENGALLVLDEVQCGLGRTGQLFAYQHAGVRPDILTLAKPLGGGLPLGAVLVREELAGALQVGDHGSTFGGNPVAAAASLAVLDRITREEFLKKVRRKAALLESGLRDLGRLYPQSIKEVRGLGLMLGVEMHGSAKAVIRGLRERGVLATRAGDNVLRLLPPLSVKRKEIALLLGALGAVLATGAGAADAAVAPVATGAAVGGALGWRPVRLLVGTSGFAYKPWKGSFYPKELPDSGMLGYYAGQFASVEINNTFYRMPSREGLEKWAAETPAEFTFVFKAPQRITHMGRLKNTGDPLGVFLETTAVLGPRRGPLLFQLPPNFRKDIERLHTFLGLLPEGVRAAFEFRHASWLDDEVYTALRDKGAALCIADTDDEEGRTPFVATAGWGYLRLRRAEYDDAALAAWRARIAAQGWDTACVFFKHEDSGAGPELAKRFLARRE